MAEYYGYKAPEQADLGKSLANVAELFIGAEEKRAAKREGEQKSLDEARKKINELEQNSNQSQTELVGRGASKARDFILELERKRKSGDITGAEFNRGMSNINDSWDSYAFTTKNMNERLAENMARAQSVDGQPPAASSNEIFNAKVQSELMNTKNKDFIVANDGNMYMIDNSNPDNPISLRSGGNIENIVDNRIDVSGLVSNGIANFGDFTVESGMTTEQGARLQKQYEAAKYDLVHSIVDKKNPRAIVSILMDNAGEDYDQYYTDTEKNSLLDEAVTREEALKGPMTPEQKSAFRSEYEKTRMIKYVLDENGALQPVVTDKMINDAYDFVDQTVEMSVGSKTTEDEPRVNRGGGPDGGKDSKLTSIQQQQISDVRAAWDKGGTETEKALRRASNDQYFFKWGDGGIEVYSKNPNPSMKEYNAQMEKYNKASQREKDQGIVKKPDKPEIPKPLATISSVDGLYPYFFGKSGQGKWLTELERQRSGGAAPPRKETTTATTKFNG
jgi:hypothetical protein